MNFRAHLESLPPYAPIEPFEVLSARAGRAPSQIIKLDANENPYGALPAAREALANLDFPHIYPDPESRALRNALSAFLDVPAEFLLAGAGADELIDLLMRVFLDPQDCILSCPPTFGMYSFDAELNAARCVEIPRRADFSLDVEAIRRAAQTLRPKMILLASPNNPDGSLIPPNVLDELLNLPVLVVLDEAYIEFADDALGASLSRIRQVPQRENLVVLRTFSKWAGLAGLRVGYGAFPRWLMPVLWKSKQPYNVNVAANAAALASLARAQQLQEIVERIKAERQRLFAGLQTIPFLQPYPTMSNFILCKVMNRDAAALKENLARHGIFIRYFNKPGLRDHVRISVGRPQDTDALLAALKLEV
ncbi:MAG: histidinol-phosphate transaminase [Anaerolineales bacterium]